MAILSPTFLRHFSFSALSSHVSRACNASMQESIPLIPVLSIGTAHFQFSCFHFIFHVLFPPFFSIFSCPLFVSRLSIFAVRICRFKCEDVFLKETSVNPNASYTSSLNLPTYFHRLSFVYKISKLS